MTEQPREPYCTTPDCDAPNHCHVHGTHHAVDSLARWCERHFKETT